MPPYAVAAELALPIPILQVGKASFAATAPGMRSSRACFAYFISSYIVNYKKSGLIGIGFLKTSPATPKPLNPPLIIFLNPISQRVRDISQDLLFLNNPRAFFSGQLNVKAQPSN